MSYELITTSKTKNRHINYRKLSDVLYGVVHWWGDDKGKSFDETVNFLCNNDRKVSANYVVEAGVNRVGEPTRLPLRGSGHAGAAHCRY